jgi:glycosyltransferase involved in cell wall biosynthesis
MAATAPNDEILISVIIPVYNRAQSVEKCLDSVASNTLAQNLYEVICVDDCSSDRTLNVLYAYNALKNLRILRREVNSGTASAPRNDGMRIARGRYLFFLDSDDSISAITLERALHLARKSNADLVCAPYWTDSGRAVSRSAFRYTQDQEDVSFLNSKLYNTLNIVGKLVRTDMAVRRRIEFPLGIRWREDNLFAMKCYAAAGKIAVLGNKDKFYYIGGKGADNLSDSKRNAKDVAFILADAMQFIFGLQHISLEDKTAFTLLFVNRLHVFLKDPDAIPAMIADGKRCL